MYRLVLSAMKKSIKNGTYNGTSIDEFYQTVVEARATQLEKEGGFPRPKANEKFDRKKRLVWQHINFSKDNKLAIPFNEFVAFHAYLACCVISSFAMTNKIKTVQEYFQQWLEFERENYYKDNNCIMLTVEEMKELYRTSILNDAKLEEAA
jgi:hypothetical protein